MFPLTYKGEDAVPRSTMQLPCLPTPLPSPPPRSKGYSITKSLNCRLIIIFHTSRYSSISLSFQSLCNHTVYMLTGISHATFVGNTDFDKKSLVICGIFSFRKKEGIFTISNVIQN